MISKKILRFTNPYLLILAIALNGLTWVYLVPLWHTPDEQSHFGQVAFFAQTGRNPTSLDKYDLTEEIYRSEQLLGTDRDKFGNNKFTFHPEYRIEYTNSLVGKYEGEIETLAKTEAKKKFVHQEAARYPILYYIPASWLYKFFYNESLFVRVFLVRFWSLSLFIATIFIVYKIGNLIFPKDNLNIFSLTALSGFQPMFIFASVGVNSDSLGNLLFTLFLFLSIKIIILGSNRIDLLYLLVVSLLSLYTKPQFIIMLPLLFILALKMLYFRKSLLNIIALTVAGAIIILLLMYLLKWPWVMLNHFMANLNLSVLFRYSKEYTFSHTISEVLPWYWGIYDWLGVTYPRIVHRIINRIMIISGIGLLVASWQVVKKKLWRKPKFQAILFMAFSAVLYFISISFFDYLSWYTSTYSLGVQGRYFFPLIVVEMLLLLIGIRSILPNRSGLKTFGTKLLSISMITLNFYAIYLVARTYYDVSSVSRFFLQASQYKPWFVKNGYFIICATLNFLTLLFGVILPIILFHYDRKKNSIIND